MRVHWLQHAPADDLGCIAPWLASRGAQLHCTRLYAGERLPERVDSDWLIVMGGPMGVHDQLQHPWLADEKRYLDAALRSDARVLGICLGAQLLADRLGGPVTRNAHTELGWFPVRLTPRGRRSRWLQDWPDEVLPFHWHGDTYALPPGACCLAQSEACAQQAFEWDGGRVLGLQFHPEVTAANARAWLDDEPPAPGPYVQRPEAMLAEVARFGAMNRLLLRLLDRLAAAGQGQGQG